MAQPDGLRPDTSTLVAMGVIAYALANLVHEAVGHGGGCAAVGGTPLVVNAIYFECDTSAVPAAGHRWMSAGGSLANFAVAALCGLLLGSGRGATPARYFGWLVMVVNLLQGTGYWLFSGIGGIGDWAEVVKGLVGEAAGRAGLSAVGLLGYAFSVWVGLRTLAGFVGDDAGRVARARRLALIPYLSGGVLFLVAGALNPASPALVLISAAAASFGGTSALAWMSELLSTGLFPVKRDTLLLPRSGAWLAAGVLAAAVFVGVLGPGLAF